MLDYYLDLVRNVCSARWQDAVLGITSAATLLALRALGRCGCFKPNSSLAAHVPPRALAVLDRFAWLLSTARSVNKQK